LSFGLSLKEIEWSFLTHYNLYLWHPSNSLEKDVRYRSLKHSADVEPSYADDLLTHDRYAVSE